MRTGRLALAVAAASLSPLVADAAGRIEGRVGDASRAVYLEGAVVTLEELGRQAATRSDGSFNFVNVPAGTYTVRVEYLGAAPVEETIRVADDDTARLDFELGTPTYAVENIIVYGQTAGTANALNRQRAADGITSVVSANAIGALPDQNAAEALQRVPGTFLERDQGEGRYIGIRGIDPDLNATSINGLRVPAPEDDKRAIQLDVVPAELLGSLEVIKSVTPDMDGDAVGGTVNVESISAFDRGGRNFSLTTEGSYTALTEDLNPRVSGSFSDVFDFAGRADSLGIAFAASWYDRQFGSDNIENGDGWPVRETLDGTEFRAAEEVEQRDYLITRERLGAALNIDFRPSDTAEYYLRALASEYSDQEFRMANILKLENAEDDDGRANVGSTVGSASWDEAELEKEFKDRYEEAQVLSLALGGRNFVDAWTLEYQAGYSYADQDTPDDTQSLFLGEGFTLGYGNIGQEIGVFGDPDTEDPANYALDEISRAGSKTEDEEVSYRFDVTRDLLFGDAPAMIKFGGKARLREKTLDEREILYDGFPGDPTLEGFATTIDGYDLDAPFIGPAIDAGATAAFIADNVDSFEVDDEETFLASSGADFEIQEDVYAAYLMSRVELGDLRLVGGVRWERTDLEAQGSAIVESDLADGPQVVPLLSDTSYDDFMPSITARWQVRDDMLIRAAASRTISRPEFGDIAPVAEVELEDSGGELELAAEVGNPELDPYQSINLDLAWEWYFGDIGVVSAGGFYKDIEDFVVRANVANFIDLTQFVGDVALDDAEVIQPINGESASLLGLELAFTRKFSELPAPFDGLLVNANATFTDSEAELALRDGDIPLPFQSDTVGNLILGYEKGPLSLRLSTTYRTERLEELVEVDDPAFDRYEDDHLQIDFAGTFDFTRQLQLSVEVVNLNDEPFYAWFEDSRFNSQLERYGRTFTMGLRWQNQ